MTTPLLIEVTAPTPPVIVINPEPSLVIEMAAIVVPSIQIFPTVLPPIEIIAGNNITVNYATQGRTEFIPVSTNGQTTFLLSTAATVPMESRASIQPSGLVLGYGVDYLVSGDELTILSPLYLEVGESILIYYY